MFRDTLKEALDTHWPGHIHEVTVPPDPSLGDYSLNLAFSLAKAKRRTTQDVGQEVADYITAQMPDAIERIEIAGPGFVNVFLKDSFVQAELGRMEEAGEHWGMSSIGGGKKVIVEYASPNIAKPMHVGHLRSTIIGDALANVYEALGYTVIRWNYIGDWGTQFGKLIAAYKRWGNEADLEEEPIKALVDLYVCFTKESANDPTLEQAGRDEFRKLEEGDTENRTLWERFRALSLKEFDAMYQRLAVALTDETTVTRGESDYEQELRPLIKELTEGGVAVVGEGGALIVDLESFGISTPGMLAKSDGATVYLTRDIASLRERTIERTPERILYVVANQQALHFEQLFAVAERMKQKGLFGDASLPALMHVKYGLVLGSDGKKFSTREGNAVPLANVLDEAELRAVRVVREKNPEISEEHAAHIARTVALAAVKYNDLRQHPHSDIVFDWDAMLDLTGNSGPYLQYTHARLRSILARAGHLSGGGDRSLLREPTERTAIRHLMEFPFAVAHSARFSTLNGLALYLYELAVTANRYYEQVRILEDENVPRKEARLVLVTAMATVLKRGLALLGISAPERI